MTLSIASNVVTWLRHDSLQQLEWGREGENLFSFASNNYLYSPLGRLVSSLEGRSILVTSD